MVKPVGFRKTTFSKNEWQSSLKEKRHEIQNSIYAASDCGAGQEKQFFKQNLWETQGQGPENPTGGIGIEKRNNEAENVY